MLLGEVVDELHDEDGLADAGAAEETDLAALDVRRDEIDDLEAGLEDLHLRREIAKCRRLAMDRPTLRIGGDVFLLVDRLADHVPEAPERGLTHRNGDRGTRVDHLGAAREAIRRVHRNCAHPVVTEVLLHLRHDLALGRRDLDGVEDAGEPIGEDGVDHDALDLDDPADVATVLGGHGSPEVSGCVR